MRIASAFPPSSSNVTVASAALYPPNNRSVRSRQRTADDVVRFPVTRTPADQRATGLLTSWKNIAAYLDRGVRTVQRWERTLGLPVHRMKGGQLAPVFAYEHEVDRWLRKTSTGPEQPSASIDISRTPLDPQPQWLTRLYDELQQNVSELERAVASNGFGRSENVTEALLTIQKLVQTALAHDRAAQIQRRIQTNNCADRHTNRKPLSERRSLA